MESRDVDDPDDVESLHKLVQQLRQREKELVHEKQEMENEFGQKRAQLKDLFIQKEEELNREKQALKEALQTKEKLESELCKLQTELNESKSLVAIAECQKENEIEAEKQKCQEEIASLQHIMKEAMADATRNSSSKLEKELIKLKKFNDKLEAELNEIKSQQAKEREGVLAVVTKSLKQRVGGLSSPIPFTSSETTENLEESMRKAQEDAEMLRSLVVPLEEEIKALKDKLRSTDEHLRMYETAFSGLVKGLGSDSLAEMLKGKSPAEVVGHLDDKLTSLSQGLQAEKASRSDLEMYVAVLNTQKSVMQDDMDRIKKELQEVCELLEKEKREHASLKRTWQMANDQFLEAQRLQFMDMRRMQSVLTAEQQRQVAEMQRKDAEIMDQERRLSRLQIPHQLESQDKPEPGTPLSSKLARRTMSPMMHRRFCSADSKSVDLLDSLISNSNKCQSAPEGLSETGLDIFQASSRSNTLHLPTSSTYCKEENLWRSVSLNGLTEKRLEHKRSQESEIRAETRSLSGLEDGSSSPWSPKKLPSLTQDQLKALSDITPELEARKSLLDNARAEMESFSLVGKRLVSEKEWQLLEEEVRRAREKLGQPCQMCSNYELQLQQLQRAEQEQKRKMSTLQQVQERYKEELTKQQTYCQEMEQKFNDMAQDSRNQIAEQMRKLEESEKMVSELKANYNEIYKQLRQLIQHREEMKTELTKLQEENNSLLGKHIMQAQQMQSEIINFPDNPEEMQFLCLKLHEDLIAAVISREKLESTLKSDILFLRDQIEAEQNAKDNLEDALTQEISNLQEQVGILESIKVELEKEQARRCEAEEKLKSTYGEISQRKEDIQQQIAIFENKVTELTDINKKLENETHELKAKVQSLQNDLDVSEAVQKDFVKLSQSLQVELEKIRQSDCEVRWQHDDDVTECNNCKKTFHSKKEKQHCKHCGKVFCPDCTSKLVRSGPQNRLFKVCNVCHTLLDRDTAPYFSSQPPQTPD
ncbi:rab GTPase-binding effector protein 1-like [Centruroides vittatus]|uniref:rab GTPase-binding effector protein 1-like n=1 Tax=Centruroides vittatus TaxID=120091 RepID=UPI0035101E8F